MITELTPLVPSTRVQVVPDPAVWAASDVPVVSVNESVEMRDCPPSPRRQWLSKPVVAATPAAYPTLTTLALVATSWLPTRSVTT